MFEIRWTEEAETHIARHGVMPWEVEEALGRPRLELLGRGGATRVYGTTDAGRHLLTVLAEASDGRWYVVTARDMSDSEKRTFRRKAK